MTWYLCATTRKTGLLTDVRSLYYMIQQFRVKQSLGFRLFCGCSKSVTGEFRLSGNEGKEILSDIYED